MGDSAVDKGSEPGLAAGEGPVGSDAPGSAIVAAVSGSDARAEDDGGMKKCNLEAAARVYVATETYVTSAVIQRPLAVR